MITQTVFDVVRHIRVAGPPHFGQGAVIGRAFVFVGNMEGDGGAGGDAVEHTGQKLNPIGFPAGGTRLPRFGATPRTPPVQLALYGGLAQGYARRATVHHAAQAGAVGFAVGGQGNHSAEGAAHKLRSPLRAGNSARLDTRSTRSATLRSAGTM